MVALSAAEAVAFVGEHGVVLASAKGPAPRLIEAIAGEAIVGNWWSHKRANEIYNVLAEVQESSEVLVCRLVRGKVTLVHCRLWPALVRLAERAQPGQLSRVAEEHTSSGRHALRETPFPTWVPAATLQAGMALSEEQAPHEIGRWLPSSSVGAVGAAVAPSTP